MIRLFSIGLPSVDTEPIPWWAYLLLMIGIAIATALIWGGRQFFRHFVIDAVPKDTLAVIVQAKDSEIAGLNLAIERKEKEIERLWTLQQITDAAREELAQSVESSTEALNANTEAMQMVSALMRAFPRPVEGGQNATTARRRSGT